MINDNTILSSFDDKPTLLEWLKKVEDALKTDTATSISVENPSVNTYVFKITFADGDSISSGNVVFPDSVKDVSIKNGHIIVTQISGTQTDLGAINPYAGTIVENAVTNTTEIGNNAEVAGDLSVQGSVVGRGIVTSIGRLTANGGIEVHGQGYVNGALGVTGNATIGGTITAGGKAIKAVEANPTGEATETLEKVKIGDVAYNVGGGSSGGGITKSELILDSTKFTKDETPDVTRYNFTTAGSQEILNFFNSSPVDNSVSVFASLSFVEVEGMEGYTYLGRLIGVKDKQAVGLDLRSGYTFKFLSSMTDSWFLMTEDGTNFSFYMNSGSNTELIINSIKITEYNFA